tara:strand:- start:37343 stop:37576 length:234 start_codon:yes stop_codon:yes gene_type:complete
MGTIANTKEERYAMIRRAAMKSNKRKLMQRASFKLIKEAVQIDRQDHNQRISYNDSSSYAAANYGDVYNATVNEEWN